MLPETFNVTSGNDFGRYMFYVRRKGDRETRRVQTAWPCVGLAVERPWLALRGGVSGRRKKLPALKGLHVQGPFIS